MNYSCDVDTTPLQFTLAFCCYQNYYYIVASYFWWDTTIAIYGRHQLQLCSICSCNW